MSRGNQVLELTTLQDILNVQDEASFEQILAEIAPILRGMRTAARRHGHAGFDWPIRWSAEGQVTIGDGRGDGAARREIPIDFHHESFRERVADAARAAETALNLPLWADVPHLLESEINKLIDFARYMGQVVPDEDDPDEPSDAPRA